MPDFLQVLDATLRRDEGFPNLAGLVVVAVRKKVSRELVYWHAALTKTTKQVGYLEGVPVNTTALLVIDEADSETLLRTGKMPASPSLFSRTGDLELLKAFSDRYLAGGRWLAVQGGQPS